MRKLLMFAAVAACGCGETAQNTVTVGTERHAASGEDVVVLTVGISSVVLPASDAEELSIRIACAAEGVDYPPATDEDIDAVNSVFGK